MAILLSVGLVTSLAAQLAVALEIHRQRQRVGFATVTLVSSDRDLNTAATAEGLAIDDPTTRP